VLTNTRPVKNDLNIGSCFSRVLKNTVRSCARARLVLDSDLVSRIKASEEREDPDLRRTRLPETCGRRGAEVSKEEGSESK
jgi:hypothetical protein